jgi:hypothetical protein
MREGWGNLHFSQRNCAVTDAGRQDFCTDDNKFLYSCTRKPFTAEESEHHRVNLCVRLLAAAVGDKDWDRVELVGYADAIFVELVGQGATGQSHAASGFGLCAAGCV